MTFMSRNSCFSLIMQKKDSIEVLSFCMLSSLVFFITNSVFS